MIQLHHSRLQSCLLVEITESRLLQKCLCKFPACIRAYSISPVTQITSDSVSFLCNENCIDIKKQWEQSSCNRQMLSIVVRMYDTSLPMLGTCNLSQYQLPSKRAKAFQQEQLQMFAHCVGIQKAHWLHFVSGGDKRVLQHLSVMIFWMSLQESFSWKNERNTEADVEDAYVHNRALHSIGNHELPSKRNSAVSYNWKLYISKRLLQYCRLSEFIKHKIN